MTKVLTQIREMFEKRRTKFVRHWLKMNVQTEITAHTNIQFYARIGYPEVTAGDGKTKDVSFIIRLYAGST